MKEESLEHGLRARLLAMMVLRVVLAIAFLGTTTWLQLKSAHFTGPGFYPIYFIVLSVGVLTIVYALTIHRVRDLRLFAYVQITIDIALITAIVYVTGGIESYLSTMYLLSVIGSSILLGRNGGFYGASFSSIAYGVLMDMDFYRMLPERYKVLYSPVQPAWEDLLTTVFTNILAFFTVAYLTGYLSERTASMERKLEEKKIDFERLASLNRKIVENITSGIMTIDNRGRITSFNSMAGRITGYTLEEVYYRPVDDVFPGLFRRTKEPRGHASRMEGVFTTKHGRELYLGLSISHGKGEDLDTIVIFQDLTRFRAMEEKLRRDEKLKALGALSAGIAHEIRNPLASISGSIQVLMDNLNVKGENGRLMEIVLRETERLNSLVTDFLLFAKPVRRQGVSFEINGLISETLEVFKNCPEAKGLVIERDLAGEIYIEGDERQMGQVFWNLFINAANAMPRGGRLAVRSVLSSACEGFTGDGGSGLSGQGVEITVADTGTGIKKEDIERIFDPFFSTSERGTGLGLALVHRIIESHGGSIRVRSAPEKGTEFTITMPVKSDLEQRPPGRAAAARWASGNI